MWWWPIADLVWALGKMALIFCAMAVTIFVPLFGSLEIYDRTWPRQHQSDHGRRTFETACTVLSVVIMAGWGNWLAR
jgi:hypothetical protein